MHRSRPITRVSPNPHRTARVRESVARHRPPGDGSYERPGRPASRRPEGTAIVGKVVAGVPTSRTPRTSPTIERSQRDSARDHPHNGGSLDRVDPSAVVPTPVATKARRPDRRHSCRGISDPSRTSPHCRPSNAPSANRFADHPHKRPDKARR